MTNLIRVPPKVMKKARERRNKFFETNGYAPPLWKFISEIEKESEFFEEHKRFKL